MIESVDIFGRLRRERWWMVGLMLAAGGVIALVQILFARGDGATKSAPAPVQDVAR